jgi:uncharacterized protein YjaZ
VHVTDYTILGGVQRMVHTAIYLKLDVHRVQIIHEAFGAETQEEDARSEERFGEADELLREFELWETAQEWAKQAKLSDQEKQVLNLDLRFHRDTRRIARELGSAEGHAVAEIRLYCIEPV